MNMSDVKRFYDEPKRATLDTAVIESGESLGRPWARLAETIFFPEGGGQPADRGRIGDASVLDVQQQQGAIVHYTDRPVPPGPTTLALDMRRRFDHCQQHTAQHLLTAVLLDRHGLATTAFHLGAEYTAIEVAGPAPTEEDLRRFSDEVNAHLREDRPVLSRWIVPEELAQAGVRSRGLPEGHVGPVRLVEIDGLDVNTCGGTHVERLGEIQVFEIIDAEAARGGTRIRFLAGERVLASLRRSRGVEEDLKARLGVAPGEFAGVLDSWSRDRSRHERRIGELEAELAGLVAIDIAAGPGPVLCAVRPGSGPEALRTLAHAVIRLRPEAVVVLRGDSGDPPESCFLVHAGPQGPADVAAIGAVVRDRLGAKGGGKGRTFQGKGGLLADRAALERATAETA